ncbi:MAG: glycosyltransferase family 2 protein [Verrucomicrobiales bacterium]|nr:glycosyltransferase family 2 protein [Verrucomicrobiales bacterium]
MTEISVIIPTLNEAESIGGTIANLPQGELEIIIADGGSLDRTREIAGEAGADLVFEPVKAGRAAQMNAGAARANGAWLIFLHADTVLPPDGADRIRKLDPEIAGGGFLRRFDSSSQILRLTCWISDFRSRLGGIFLGDQAIFVRRENFEKLGGFDESFRLGEDIDFSRRLRKSGGKTIALRGPAVSSARRFEKLGPFRQSVIDFWITIRFLANPRAYSDS